jgi:hypothetical protein
VIADKGTINQKLYYNLFIFHALNEAIYKNKVLSVTERYHEKKFVYPQKKVILHCKKMRKY